MLTPLDAPYWRKMSQEERDLGLNNGVAVPGSADIVAGWDKRSAEMRARTSGHLDLRYGPRERNRIDFLKAADGGPTLLFIHGGYWRTRAKETFAVFAGGLAIWFSQRGHLSVSAETERPSRPARWPVRFRLDGRRWAWHWHQAEQEARANTGRTAFGRKDSAGAGRNHST